ncbi:MAG TPA: hypothetical protein VK009_25885 [Chloroflexota bacterium]|nr:hypothetical protein [Chloroflexota bacterium]
MPKFFLTRPLLWSSGVSCALFAVLAGQFLWVTPILETSDATGHYRYVRAVARDGHLLTASTDPYSAAQEGGQPPLYYLVAGAVLRPFPDGDLDSVLVPDTHNSAGSGLTKNFSFHRPFKGFPQGAELAVRMVELFSIACGIVTVSCAVLLARLLEPCMPGLWLAAGCAAAVVPAFDFLSTGVTNDNLVAALCSVTLVLLAKWQLDAAARWGWLSAIALWLAVMTKFIAIGLAGCYLLALLFREQDAAGRLRGLAKLTLTGAVIAGWWFVRNVQLYGEPTGIMGINRAYYGSGYAPLHLSAGDALQRLASQLPRTFYTFFVAFGHYNIDAPLAFPLLGLAGGLGAAAGVAVLVRRRNEPVVGLLLSWPAIAGVQIVGYSIISGGEGRFLYPAMAPLAVLAATGWRSLCRRLRLRLMPLLAGGCALVSCLCAWLVVRPAYAYPPMLPQVPPSATAIGATFAGAAQLAGAELSKEQPPVLTLYWRRIAPLNLALSEFIHIESSDPSYRPGYSFDGTTGGNFPPSFWPTDRVVVDEHKLRLAPDGRPDRRNPVLLTVRTGMYYVPVRAGAAPERVATDPPEASDRGVEVGHLKLPGAAPAPPSRPLARFANGLDLLEAQLDNGLVSLRWYASAVTSQNATVFVQALDNAGRLLAQHDSYPLEGRYPTSLWSQGEQVFDQVKLQKTRFESGDQVIVGLYVWPDADKRIPTMDGQLYAVIPRQAG